MDTTMIFSWESKCTHIHPLCIDHAFARALCCHKIRLYPGYVHVHRACLLVVPNIFCTRRVKSSTRAMEQ